MENLQLKEFTDRVLKRNTPKKFAASHSFGIKAGWRWLKKNKWLSLNQPITELQFGTIIRRVNEYLVEKLLLGGDIIFPYKMGKLSIRKYPVKIEFKNDILKTNLHIDWKRTLNFWHEDEEAFKNKVILRCEDKNLFSIIYLKKYSQLPNKKYYTFVPTRTVKRELSRRANNNELDAFLFCN